ncbi:MAG TPA: 30S ribosomal protein S4 [Candidatus Paceibacterota bacterium]
MKIGPKYKIARRLGDAIFEKTRTQRFAMVEGKKKADIQKRKKHRSMLTEYGIQFLEKQKIRFTYGINEKQLSNYMRKAKSVKGGVPSELAYGGLERRLDNVVYRLGLVPTRQFARQVVTHGHIRVNGKRVSSPSYEVKVGDEIGVRPGSLDSGLFKSRRETLKDYNPPAWVSLDLEKLSGMVVGSPKLGDYDSNLNFGLVVQFYSRV